MPIMVTCNWYIALFLLSVSKIPEAQLIAIFSWQAEVAGSCPDMAEAPLLKHSKCSYWSFERVPNVQLPEKNEAAEA